MPDGGIANFHGDPTYANSDGVDPNFAVAGDPSIPSNNDDVPTVSTFPKAPADAKAKGTGAAKKVKPQGFTKAIAINHTVKGPNGCDVHYVDGGTVVHNVFTRTVKNTKRPPHVTREEWDSAKKDRLKQWGWQKEWDDLHPDRGVVEVQIDDETKSGDRLLAMVLD